MDWFGLLPPSTTSESGSVFCLRLHPQYAVRPYVLISFHTYPVMHDHVHRCMCIYEQASCFLIRTCDPAVELIRHFKFISNQNAAYFGDVLHGHVLNIFHFRYERHVYNTKSWFLLTRWNPIQIIFLFELMCPCPIRV